jgi:hypothetical protein
VKLIEGITPNTHLVSEIFMWIYSYLGDLASTHTSMRGGSFKVSGFSTLPIRRSRLTIAHLYIGYIVVYQLLDLGIS